jgi:cell division protein FtsZ
MPEIKPNEAQGTANIKVVGVGGAGGNAINRMREMGLSGVQLIAMNTDAQDLRNSKADVKVHLKSDDGRALGAGADPLKGEKAAQNSLEDIRAALQGADMVFVAFGAGGGTGSGAGYVVAEEARNLGILTVGVVTKPFEMEREVRRRNAEWAIERLARNVDALITIPNDRLLEVIDPNIPWRESFKIADDVLRQAVQGITEIITEEHGINIDFADVCAVMKDAGSALMGIGRASGENRAALAAQQAIESPLIEVSIDGARGILYLVSGGDDVTMAEIKAASDIITANVNPEANVIMGLSTRPELEDEIMVTVIATGFDSEYYRGDPRAQEVFGPNFGATPEVPAQQPIVNSVEDEPVAPVAQTPVMPSTPIVEDNDDDIRPESTGASDFTGATTVNIWNNIPDTDENDIPAILRRKKKNKN